MPTKNKKAKKQPKLVMRDERTGLLIGPDTQLIIASGKDAEMAVEAAGKLQDEIAEIRAENNLAMLEAELENLRKSLRDYQNENDDDDVVAGGYVSHLTQRRKAFWVWDKRDIPENIVFEDDVVPLRDVLRRKFRDLKKRNKIINRVTVRMVVPEKLDELVREGLLKADDIQDSLAEYVETSYVQVKEVKK
jgi:hypothetical protein